MTRPRYTLRNVIIMRHPRCSTFVIACWSLSAVALGVDSFPLLPVVLGKSRTLLAPTTTTATNLPIIRTSHRRFAAQKDPNLPRQSSTVQTTLQNYVSLLRPVTLLQAVGAWVVGRLLVSPIHLGDPQEWWAMLVVYLSYGVGMAANDCADAALDATTNDSKKSNRAIASGRVSVQRGWMFVGVLTATSLLTAFLGVSHKFGWWCASNLTLMLLYAGGLQNILLVKNIVVGWLCVSPLWGATTLVNASISSTTDALLLAAAGFSLGVVREILKDIQDVELDRGAKSTLPLWVGVKAAQRLAFAALGCTLAILQTPLYRRAFASSSGGVPLYSTAWVLASLLCLRASARPTIDEQQVGVKQSIYVLLLGLIGSMALARR